MSCPRPCAGDSGIHKLQVLPLEGDPTVASLPWAAVALQPRGGTVSGTPGLERLYERGPKRSSWSPVPGT